jgi:hypothetical protein
LEFIVTSPFHQDEENFPATLKKRIHHYLDRHAYKNKLHSLGLPTIAQTKGENSFRNVEHDMCVHAHLIALKAQQCEAQMSSNMIVENDSMQYSKNITSKLSN